MAESDKSSLVTGIGFIISGGLATGYWIGLEKMDPGSCSGTPYSWAVFSKYYLSFCAATLLLIMILNHSWKNDYTTFKKAIIWLLFLPNIGTVAYVIGAFLTFSTRHSCPGLHDILIVTFWVAILICCSSFIWCFHLCVSGGLSSIRACLTGEHRQPTDEYRNLSDVRVHDPLSDD